MNVFKALGKAFKAIGKFAVKAFGIAQEKGLTDDLVQLALGFVTAAAGKFDTNAEKREWAVVGLQAAGVGENIARIAIELAVALFKKGDTAPLPEPAPAPAPEVPPAV